MEVVALPGFKCSGLWGWVLKYQAVRLKGRNSSHPAPDLQIVHLGPWHRKDLHFKAQVIFHLLYRYFSAKQTELVEDISANMAVH